MIAVVGGGVTGLAIALALRQSLPDDVVVLERHARPGQEASTHNSGVIHAGLYYPPGSLKAQLCVEGRERLYAFCDRAGVPNVRCGKLVVANDDLDDRGLDALAGNAANCGVKLEPADAAFIRAREPHVRARRGLWSPDTGWVDTPRFVSALRRAAESHGAHFLPASEVVAAGQGASGIEIVTPRERIEAQIVVNAAGVYADKVSQMMGGEAFRIYPCRGEYVELAPRARQLVNGLVYPVPQSAGHGLGVHLTRTLDGEVLAGPTIRYQDSRDDLETNREPVEAFVDAVRVLLPRITAGDLRAGGSGIRAKLNDPHTPFADFMVRWDAQSARLLHAAGIDSPGLTSSLAIGRFVADLVAERAS